VAARASPPGRLHDDWPTALMALVLELVVPAGGGFGEYYREEITRLRAAREDTAGDRYGSSRDQVAREAVA
jgi:hypothetical protein